MLSDLLTFYGETDGTSATGTFTLKSPQLYGTVTSIKLDKGLAAKIWGFEVDGKAVTVIVKYSTDGGDTWNSFKPIHLASEGHVDRDLRRPILIEAKNDETYFKIEWSQDTPGKSYVGITVEFDEME